MTKRHASAKLTARLQARTAFGFYGDTASILQDTVTSLDANRQPNVSTVSTSVSCNFTDKPKVENWKGYADIEQLAAEIRYAGSPVPAKGNRVTLTGRFDGTDYVDTTYEVIGIRDRDTMGYAIALAKVNP